MLRILFDEPALLVKRRGHTILMIPDLHLGYERALSEKGVNLPSQTDRILKRILKLSSDHRPDEMIFLGDVKHSTGKLLDQERYEIPKFFESVKQHVPVVRVIPGNHDGNISVLLPEGVKTDSPHGTMVEDSRGRISLLHGHTWPHPEAFGCSTMVMGHQHFSLKIKEESGYVRMEPVWLVARAVTRRLVEGFLQHNRIPYEGNPEEVFERTYGVVPKSFRIVVAPTFNRLFTGQAVRHVSSREHLGPFFKSEGVDLRNAQVVLLDGTFLNLRDIPLVQRSDA